MPGFRRLAVRSQRPHHHPLQIDRIHPQVPLGPTAKVLAVLAPKTELMLERPGLWFLRDSAMRLSLARR